MAELTHGPYRISRLPSVEPPPRKRPYTGICVLVSWALWAIHLAIEAYLVYVSVADAKCMWRLWILLVAEAVLVVPDFVWTFHACCLLLSTEGLNMRPKYRLLGDEVPTVDILVPCCRENIEIIANTVRAAASQKYPAARFRVIVLDDGHDQTLKNVIEGYAETSKMSEGPGILYRSRTVPKGERTWYKGGNLKYGVEESRRTMVSDYIASIDADMITEPDWLRRLVPHLILDDKLAMICPPQRYYNIMRKDEFGQQAEFDFFFTVFEPVGDMIDGAMCTGTGFVAKRDALESIGGWVLCEAGEDYLCSSVLGSTGWKVGFIEEYVQIGLTPENMKSYVKQRLLWIDSALETHKYFNYYLPGYDKTSSMTMFDRGLNFLFVFRDNASVPIVMSLLMLPILLLPTSHTCMTEEIAGSTKFWSRVLFVVSIACLKLKDYQLYSHIGLSRLWNFQALDIWFAPQFAIQCILNILPPTIHHIAFTASGSVKSKANERSVKRRLGLPYRLVDISVLMSAFYMIYGSSPFWLRLFSDSHTSLPFFLLPGVTFRLLDAIWKASVPLRYMLFPPDLPEWSDLVELADDGVLRPKLEQKEFPVHNAIIIYREILVALFIAWIM